MYDFILSFIVHGTDCLLSAECVLAGQAPPAAFHGAGLGALGAGEGAVREVVPHPAPRRLSTCPEAEAVRAAKLGRELYQAVFHSGVDELLERSLAATRQRKTGLRILIKAHQVPAIQQIAWELLHDGRRFLAHRLETPIVRYVEQPRPVHNLQVDPPLRVLFSTACPPGEEPLDLRGEERLLREALAPLEGRVELTVEQQVSWERLRFCMLRAETERRPFHVWHHGGHGGLHRSAGRVGFSLCLRDSAGARQPTGSEEMQPTFERCPGLRVAVLNVCHSASPAGLASLLANLNIPGVVGFRSSILDRSALVFAEGFYASLIERPLEEAITLARLELLHAGSGPLDWAQPLLFARTTMVQPILATRGGRKD